MEQTTKTAVEIEYDESVIGDHAHDFTRTYHSRREISDAVVSELPGIEKVVYQRRYSVQVIKARLFSWDEVELAVLELLGK